MSREPALDLSVPLPDSDELAIWRYMDFAKFVWLLEARCLFFARVPLLGDAFEGSFPESQPPISRLLELLPPGSVPPDAVVHLSPGLDRIWQVIRNWASVNCWHASEHESDAMWKLYAAANASVAIRSTVGGLRQALGARPVFEAGMGGADGFRIGKVLYIDYQTERIPVTSFASQFFRKRRAFEHESEIRVLLIDFPVNPDNSIDFGRTPSHSGRIVRVDLPTLLSEVVIAPASPAWHSELVQALIRRYDLSVPVRASEMGAHPNY